MSADFQILPSDFNETTVTFVALTESAKEAIYGGVSVQIRKSRVPGYVEMLETSGFVISFA